MASSFEFPAKEASKEWTDASGAVHAWQRETWTQAVGRSEFGNVYGERITHRISRPSQGTADEQVKEQLMAVRQTPTTMRLRWQTRLKQVTFGPPGSDAAGPDGKVLVHEVWENEHEFDERSWFPHPTPMPASTAPTFVSTPVAGYPAQSRLAPAAAAPPPPPPPPSAPPRRAGMGIGIGTGSSSSSNHHSQPARTRTSVPTHPSHPRVRAPSPLHHARRGRGTQSLFVDQASETESESDDIISISSADSDSDAENARGGGDGGRGRKAGGDGRVLKYEVAERELRRQLAAIERKKQAAAGSGAGAGSTWRRRQR